MSQHHYPGVPGVRARFGKAAPHRRGLVARVQRAGTISAGNRVRVALTAPAAHPAPTGHCPPPP